jgi:hypothetical protein
VKKPLLFKRSVRSIERKYHELGYELGWSFLYSPARTLSLKTKIVFIGLNPGGFNYEEPMPSYERGNAYRLQSWGRNGREKNKLQSQISRFYQQIADKIGVSSECLMDSTLAANFCPFRSGNWASLQNKKEAIEFSNGLWSELFDNLNPAVILCLRETHRHIYSLIVEKRFKTISPVEKLETGWGKIKFSLAAFAVEKRKVLLVGLPHLSRFTSLAAKLLRMNFTSLQNQ